ncbi:MAG: hypothetical protein U0792_23540 [Gemmataceae bacterium]
MFSFTKELAEVQERKRIIKQKNAAKLPLAELELTTLRSQLSQSLGLRDPEGVPDFRILRAVGGRKYPKPQATSYAVETEKGIFAVVYRLADQAHISRPTKEAGPAILYVSHHSADAELREEPLLAELVKAEPKSTFYAMDVRRWRIAARHRGGTKEFLTPYGSDYFYAIHGIMVDRPYVGQKTFDVLRARHGSRTSATGKCISLRRDGARSRRHSRPCCRAS